MAKKQPKFKVGDEVEFHSKLYGAQSPDGMTGTIIKVSSTSTPGTRYTVAFYGFNEGHSGHEPIGTRNDCWYCSEKNLAFSNTKTMAETAEAAAYYKAITSL